MTPGEQRTLEEIGDRNRPFARIEGLFLPQTNLEFEGLENFGSGNSRGNAWGLVLVLVVIVVIFWKRKK